MGVDHTKASKVLLQAFKKASSKNYKPCSVFKFEIQNIVSGTHKTFKYILVTSLLARAADSQANPLALQAGSTLRGAFDARSLCHSVLVPFEKEHLANALGGSNEPYLNKPARFPELKKSNAVRRGNDQRILNLLCDFLPKIKGTKEAFECLADALLCAIKNAEVLTSIALQKVHKEPSYTEINDFVADLVSKSLEGETLALVAGALFAIFGETHSNSLDVKVHPVNQSGASSKEISDIDVYFNKSILYTAEVKDKDFYAHDVRHAISKVVAGKCDRLIFIKGPHGVLKEDSEENLTDYAKSKGVFLSFFSVNEFAKSILTLMAPINTKQFFESMRRFALTQKFKQPTIDHLVSLATKYGWIKS